MHVTQKQVKAYAKEHGLKATWSGEWQEWSIGRKGAPDADYFTSDNEDALDQLMHLAAQDIKFG